MPLSYRKNYRQFYKNEFNTRNNYYEHGIRIKNSQKKKNYREGKYLDEEYSTIIGLQYDHIIIFLTLFLSKSFN